MQKTPDAARQLSPKIELPMLNRLNSTHRVGYFVAINISSCFFDVGY